MPSVTSSKKKRVFEKNEDYREEYEHLKELVHYYRGLLKDTIKAVKDYEKFV